MKKSESIQNRLIHEQSPYLLQHADNPVDWYPWGEEAFAAAREQNKPVFLSIGYSTCHWCHVMARESFEDPEVAAKINAYFIPVKVDREERPDIDQIYMSAVQAMTGQGGWPLTVFLTHEGEPFYGGTYFPPYEKWGNPGLTHIMEQIHRSWTSSPEEILSSGKNITRTLREHIRKTSVPGVLDPVVMTEAFQQFDQSFDARNGGFGSAPKFPSSHNLSFLLHYWLRTGNDRALEMVTTTLRQMARGGLHDHLGGGFHRYSTDGEWQIPHFEKMLYDQAILARTYTEAFQITGEPFFAGVAKEILDYVLRDLTGPEGGFYSAEDADSLDPYETASSRKKEGAWYLWTDTELKQVLGEEVYPVFAGYFGILAEGNARQDPHNEFAGRNVLAVESSPEDLAAQFGMEISALERTLSEARNKLFEIRNRRVRPHLDDKVLTDWNGLMIASMAFAGRVFQDERYIDGARRAADFLLETMWRDGRLAHRYRSGEAGIEGMLDDYIFLAAGLLELYQSTFKARYLETAKTLTDEALRLFHDADEGGFYFTSGQSEKLLFRQKDVYDGAIPSGNSMAAWILTRLTRITMDPGYEKKAEELFRAFASMIRARPGAYTQLLIAFDFAMGPSQEMVLSVPDAFEDPGPMLELIEDYFLPNKVLIYRDESADDYDQTVTLAPFIREQKPRENQPTLFICENHSCQFPRIQPEKMREALSELTREPRRED